MKKNRLPIRLILSTFVLLFMISYWMHCPSTSYVIPLILNVFSQYHNGPSASNTGIPNQKKNNQHMNTSANASSRIPIEKNLENNSSGPNEQIALTQVKPIVPTQTDEEILQNIAKQNEYRDKVTTLLAANAKTTAQIRQENDVNKYQIVLSQNIPLPDKTPAPADLLAKLKSNQLMHH